MTPTLTKLRSVRVRQFKRVVDAAFDLGDVNVLVGGNNSGKSSVIQALHFGVGLLQTIGPTASWSARNLSTSLNPGQLIYSPAENVYALGRGGKLVEDKGQAIRLDLDLESGEQCSIAVRKGRNRNILVSVENAPAARQLASLARPFSVFSPGLAGISKRESYVSDGVLFRTLARGDANLVLRNILLRLWKSSTRHSFLEDLRNIFPHVNLRVDFNSETDEFIQVSVCIEGKWVPLEIAGTGVLQATQILSYIHRFEPSIVVLDEPDSHLHPNNQRLLCALLRDIAHRKGTQVLLTTHSRHVVDALSGTAYFLWVRNGYTDAAQPEDEIGILLDMGALDIKERISQRQTRAVVLTEDEITGPLEMVLKASGFDLASTVVLPYYGVTGLKQLRPLINLIGKSNPKAKIIVHRDRDFLKEDEVEAWCSALRRVGAEPFVTRGREIESYFLDPKYLADANQQAVEKTFEQMIASAIEGAKQELISDYVNGRVEIARKNGAVGRVNHGALAVEANSAVSSKPRFYCGKSILGHLKRAFQGKYKTNLLTSRLSPRLQDDVLVGIAKRTFGSKSG